MTRVLVVVTRNIRSVAARHDFNLILPHNIGSTLITVVRLQLNAPQSNSLASSKLS
jgi:hypothetical protein